MSTYSPVIQEHQIILVVPQDSQKKFEVNMTKAFSIWKHPRALFTACSLQTVDSMSLVTRALFHFQVPTNKTQICYSFVLGIQFSLYIIQSKTSWKVRVLKCLQKIILALEIAKLTSKGEKKEQSMCAFFYLFHTESL